MNKIANPESRPDEGNRARPAVLAALIFGLMLPVTAMVPVLQDLTGSRHPDISVFQQHLFMSVNMVGAFLFAPSLVMVGEIAGESDKASCMAAFHTAGSLGFLLGPLFGGAAVTVLPGFGLPAYTGAFFLAGALEIACAAGCLLLVRTLHSPSTSA